MNGITVWPWMQKSSPTEVLVILFVLFSLWCRSFSLYEFFFGILQIRFVNEKRKEKLWIPLVFMLSGVVKFARSTHNWFLHLLRVLTQEKTAPHSWMLFFSISSLFRFCITFLNVAFRICVITTATSMRDYIDLLIYSRNQVLLPTALFLTFHFTFVSNKMFAQWGGVFSTNFETYKKCDSFCKNTKLYSKKISRFVKCS